MIFFQEGKILDKMKREVSGRLAVFDKKIYNNFQCLGSDHLTTRRSLGDILNGPQKKFTLLV